MERWAELLIVAVKKDSYGRITDVKVRIDLVKSLSQEIILDKKSIINILKVEGLGKIKTAYIEDGNWKCGANVKYYEEKNGFEYLITQSNQSSKDNLDNLPEF